MATKKKEIAKTDIQEQTHNINISPLVKVLQDISKTANNAFCNIEYVLIRKDSIFQFLKKRERERNKKSYFTGLTYHRYRQRSRQHHLPTDGLAWR